MRYCSLKPSLLTFVSLLGFWSSQPQPDIELSKQIHSLIIKSGTSLDLYAGSSLIDINSKISLVNDAKVVLSLMHNRDMVVWDDMVFGLAQNEQGDEAVKLFNQLPISGSTPNEFTFVALVTMASLFHGQQFHAQVIRAGDNSAPMFQMLS
jgi:hypothetical protein